MHVYKRGEHVMNSKIINLRIHVRTHLFVKVCDDDCRFTVLQQYGLICRAREHEWVKEIMYVFHSVHALGCLAVPNGCGPLHSLSTGLNIPQLISDFFAQLSSSVSSPPETHPPVCSTTKQIQIICSFSSNWINF
jgi:hypothetical protein